MESPVLFVIILSVITAADNVRGQDIFASENPVPVGSNVTIHSNTIVTTGAWIFDNKLIVLIFPGNTVIFNPWKNRVTFNSSTSSLTLRSLMLKDSGEYTLQGEDDFNGQLTLSVQVPISAVTLRAQAANLVEFNDTAVLMCSVSSGTTLSYEWLRGNSTITADEEVQFSNGNATLTIVNVTRDDKGPFRCNVSNGVSNEISLPVPLNISYGPSNATIMIMPMRYIYKTGSNITLTCSADSSPPAMIQWLIDEVHLNHFGPKLQLERVTEINTGKYKCLFHNTVTSRFSGASAMIRILDPLTTVVVNHTGGPPILHEKLTLHCEVNGSTDSIQWWRNGQLISADNTTAFDMNNKTLIINPVQHSDGGDYQCQAFNYVSNMSSSPYTVEINYGPEKPTITGSKVVKTGDNVTLSCHAKSYPPSYYKWYFNNSIVSNMSEYVSPPLTTDMSGKYICMAFNNITGKNITAYTMLTVVDPIQNVQVEALMYPAKEGHSYNLTCNVTGPVDHVYWMKNGKPLHEDNRTVFYMDNKTVTFNPVKRYNAGDYQCKALNAVGNMTSPAYMLHVNYGPEKPTITASKVVKTGDNVTLSCHAKSYPPSYYKWYFNNSIVSNMSEYVSPPLTTDMSGKYICMAFNNITGKNITAYTMLTVVDPIQNVQVEALMYPAKEGHSYNLTCNVTGPVDHVYWMKNGKPLHEDNRTVFYMDNKTVTFNPVKRYDAGDYQCKALNAVGNMTSPAYMLHVNFGPDTPVIHGPAFAETGRSAVFNCSAMSMPPSSFSWWYNNSMVANTSVFMTDILSLNMSGEYTCMAHNYVTGKNSTSSTNLTVIEAIESVMVRNDTIPINNENFTLTCDVVGPYDMIYWMKNKMKLNVNTSATNPHMSYHTEKNMLHFTPATTHSDGEYQCVAHNRAAQHKSSKYKLLVNYGPLEVYITGPDSAAPGVSVSLTCSADSRPECDFYWFFNNQSVVLKKGSVITFSVTKQSVGMYICKARNPVTNITMDQTKSFVIGHNSAIRFSSQGSLMLMAVFALSAPVLLI